MDSFRIAFHISQKHNLVDRESIEHKIHFVLAAVALLGEAAQVHQDDIRVLDVFIDHDLPGVHVANHAHIPEITV